MAYLIPTGAVVTLLGLAGLVLCILKVTKARNAGVDGDALKAVMQSTVALNLGSLCVSAIGLMMVVIGIILS
ncbi:MAG: hypothetical protein ABJ327_01945 [Litoreibacter sp.]